MTLTYDPMSEWYLQAMDEAEAQHEPPEDENEIASMEEQERREELENGRG